MESTPAPPPDKRRGSSQRHGLRLRETPDKELEEKEKNIALSMA
jgi:hypothetical protein